MPSVIEETVPFPQPSKQVLSEGAGKALSIVASRLLKSERRGSLKKDRSTVLRDNDEVADEKRADVEAKRIEK